MIVNPSDRRIGRAVVMGNEEEAEEEDSDRVLRRERGEKGE